MISCDVFIEKQVTGDELQEPVTLTEQIPPSSLALGPWGQGRRQRGESWEGWSGAEIGAELQPCFGFEMPKLLI